MIETKNLSMFYGSFCAVDRVSFSIGEREIVGLLGPNGAGKTTLMRILTTFIYPTRGTALVGGFDVTRRPIEARRVCGYLPETPPLYQDMRVDEFLSFVARARGLRRERLKSRRDWVIDACGLAPVLKHAVYELSLGFRQRVGLAQALVHDPKIVILDEPTSGLDPIQIVGIRRLIRDLAREKTILFSTHILQEAAAISDRLLIIREGRVEAQGTIEELQAHQAGRLEETLYLAFSAPPAEVHEAMASIRSVKHFAPAGDFRGCQRLVVVTASYDETVKAVSELVRSKGWTLKECSRKTASVEDLFLELFKKTSKKKEASS